MGQRARIVNEEEVKNAIEKELVPSIVTIESDGHHFEAVIISPLFAGCSRIKRHQMVYSVVGKWISTGELHAFSFKTYTNEEWVANG